MQEYGENIGLKITEVICFKTLWTTVSVDWSSKADKI